MGRFSTIFGAAAIAGSVTTLAQAEETPQGVLTDVNGSLRVQSHDLPTDPLPNFFGDHEDLPRNPGRRFGHPVIDENGIPSDSIGTEDDRIMVTHGMREYDPVLQMMDSNDRKFCTATIAESDGYDLKNPGTIITTAAHCLEQRDPFTEEHISFMKPEDIFFKGSYLDEFGVYQEFSLRADKIWINPLYLENDFADREFFQKNGHYKDSDVEADTVIIYSQTPTPIDVTPAIVYPATRADALERLSDRDNELLFTAAGHSGDKGYLTADERVMIAWGDYDGLHTNADIVPGASGGPLFMASEEDPVVKDDEGRPVLFAVNSTIWKGEEFARHSYFNQDTMNMVPFLTAAGQDPDAICYQTGEVIADGLNIRVAPDVNYQTLAAGAGQTSSQLSSGVLFTVHDMTRNSLGQQWALVTTEFGRTGYISANPDYVRIEPESCLKLKL